jgi:ribosomal protein S11
LARVSIKKLILIFKNFGISYTQLGQTNKNLDRLRILVINQLIFFKIPITQLIEHSPIAYNGCRLKKSRRKKRRYFEQNLPKLK